MPLRLSPFLRGMFPVAVMLLLAGGPWPARASAAPGPDDHPGAEEGLDIRSGFLEVTIDGRRWQLDSMSVRPAGAGPFPVAIITHGSSSPERERERNRRATDYFRIAREFAWRGWLAVAVIRRGYGRSGGPRADFPGDRCRTARHRLATEAAADDLGGAVEAIRAWPVADGNRFMIIGPSTGGMAATLLASRGIPGIVAYINFSGGRGGIPGRSPCNIPELVRAFGDMGRNAAANGSVPGLWLYASNDSFFPPAIARAMFNAYTGHGGRNVHLRTLPPFGQEGHYLFGNLIRTWSRHVDRFLRANGLPTWDPGLRAVAGKRKLGPDAQSVFETYLAAGGNKAFAHSVATGYVFARVRAETMDEAAQEAINGCSVRAPDCELIMRNYQPVALPAAAGP